MKHMIVVIFLLLSTVSIVSGSDKNVWPDIGGISLSTDYHPGLTSNSTMSWVVNETIVGNIVGTYELVTRATVNETGKIAQVTTTVNVTSDEEKPVLNPLGSSPDAISISTPTDTLFTTILSGSDLKPTGIVVENLDESGNPVSTLGGLVDNGTSGDLQSNDYVYSGTFSVNSATEGKLLFRAKADFPGLPEPVYSDTYELGVTRFPTSVHPSDMSKVVIDPATGEKIISNEVVVNFVEGTDPDTIESIVNSVGGAIVGTIFGLGAYQIEIPDTGDASGVNNAINALTNHSEVDSAEANGVGKPDSYSK